MVYEYKWKKRKRRKLEIKKFRIADKKRIIVVGLFLVVVLFAVYILLQRIFYVQPGLDYFSLIPELSIVEYAEVEIDAYVDEETGLGVVTLTGGCYSVTATTEEIQANSIANGLIGYIGPRPGTHDLVKDALDQLGVEVVMVKVTEVRDDTFIGKLILRKGNRIISLDARPSDATAIAVRMGAPVYVKNELMENYGENIC